MSLSLYKSYFSQYYPPKATFTEADLTPGSQNGRVFIVTGGNTGIGFELCKLLITTGATIYMASRSKVSRLVESVLNCSNPTASSSSLLSSSPVSNIGT